ncbi:MAG: hypothetical protein KDI54_16475, partial [Gammaproteobacteria bacterium]|nr:hypothetical protein [Gammaproteobacteria bacterium]
MLAGSRRFTAIAKTERRVFTKTLPEQSQLLFLENTSDKLRPRLLFSRRVHHFHADLVFELLPDRLHRLAPD